MQDLSRLRRQVNIAIGGAPGPVSGAYSLIGIRTPLVCDHFVVTAVTHVMLDHCRYLTSDPSLYIYSKLKAQTKLEIHPDLTTVREVHASEGIDLTSFHNCQSLSQISVSRKSDAMHFIATLQMINEPLLNLRSIRLFNCGRINVVQLLRVKFPALKDLRLYGSDLFETDALRSFANSFPNLESIGLTVNKITEELVTSASLLTWRKTLTELFLEFENADRCSQVFITLTNLPNLKKLGISFNQLDSEKSQTFQKKLNWTPQLSL